MFENIATDIPATAAKLLSYLVSDQTIPVFRQIILLAAGIFVYAFITFNFYRGGVSKRDFIGFHAEIKGKFLAFLFGVFQFFFALPLLVFLWFCLFSALLLIISNLPSHDLMILSIAIISAVRIAAYYSEDLASEIAKTLPIVLLATILSKPNFLIFSTAQARLQEGLLELNGVWSFLAVVILIEFVLRTAYLIVRLFSGKE